MKQLHKLIIKSFVGPFLLTFTLSVFILVMQFLWKYVDDLMGKGLEWTILVELLFYASANLVILALPLAILLSSIMTMGNLGESYEIVAMKASGMSLLKILRPLFATILTLAFSAFLFANFVWPAANLKFKSLLFDVTRKKPTLNLKENIFYNGLEGYSIRVKEKDKETDELHHILIYDHSKEYRGNKKVIRAKRGNMEKTKDERYLILTLFDGKSYEELDKVANTKKNTHPHMKSTFQKQIIRFDMMDFQLKRSKKEMFSNDYEMLNLNQLSMTVDSMDMLVDSSIIKYKKQLSKNFYVFNEDSNKVAQTDTAPSSVYKTFNSLALGHRKNTLKNAVGNVRKNKRFIEMKRAFVENKKTMKTRYNIEWHRKFTFSIACFVLFLIGAPVGAISKKGGLGMPVVFSIILFLVYHVISMIGEKMAESMVVEAWLGMWLGTFILLPVGVFLTYKANKDSKLLEIETYIAPMKRIFSSSSKKE